MPYDSGHRRRRKPHTQGSLAHVIDRRTYQRPLCQAPGSQGEPNFDATLDDTGVSSVDAVEFITKVEEAFGVTIPPETFAEFRCLRDLATYLESRAG